MRYLAMRWAVQLAVVFMPLVGIAACSEDSPVGPRNDRAYDVTSNSEQFPSMGTASDRLAQQVPGFGGAFVSDGVLYVYLQSSLIGNAPAEGIARQAVASLLQTAGRPPMPVDFLPAKHSFIQLRRWEAAIAAHYRALHVHSASIDERHNRLRLTVAQLSEASAVRDRAAAVHIPDEAVHTRVRPHGTAYADLWDKIRPARGGLGIRV